LKDSQAEIIKKLIEPIRKKMPRYGGEKLFLDIKKDLERNDIKMGRDQFMTFLREHHLLVKKTKKHHITTNSKHFYYKSPNLIKDLVPTYAEQVFVNDITYVDIDGQHGYLALVTDWFSKMVMGYKLDDNMRVLLTKDALEMAVKNRIYTHENIIHHSDRGLQYCCPDYSEFAQKRGMILSTTQQYDPYENAVAERINGIIKYEFGFIKKLPSMEVAQKMIVQAIEIYNNERRHKSLNMKTPAQAHRENNHEHKFYKKLKLQKSET
jgi:transposase InsO family protein